MEQIVEFEKCCGCGACQDVCPHNAITLKMERGYLHPIIDSTKCVDCKRCVSVCPVQNNQFNDEYDEFNTAAYAAWNTNDQDLFDSTSGGMFIALAKYYFSRGGYVSGCVFSDDYKSCHHIVTNDEEDLKKLIHSKYFQSDMKGVYKDIKHLLESGKEVMFCGTPCQAAALYAYLEKTDRSKLLLVDVFCKGVPSQVVHEKYLTLLEKKEKSRIVYFRPKSKIRGWGKYYTEVAFENGKKRLIRSALDTLFVNKNLDVRESCSFCEYKGYDRVSDISIGDYWGISNIDEQIKKKGVSAVVAFTQKGEDILRSLGDSIELAERTVFDISNHRNKGFGNRIELSGEYQEFYNDLEKLPFKKVLKKYAVNNSLHAIAFRKAQWAWSKIVKISIPKFIYINFLCRHVKRGKHAFIIPGSHTCFSFKKGSVLTLERGTALINIRKPKGSKEEAWIELGENAKFIIHKGLDMRNSRIGVQANAVLDIVDLEMNGRCNIMVRKAISFGDRNMMARNVTVYDSDYHPFSIGDGVQTVSTKPVVIGDDVWIGNGASIMKGVHIGDGAVVGTRAYVVKRVKPHTMVSGNPATEICKDVYWSKGH